ncbi:type A chloramphenicol O-acetyltransferase [Paenibacillus sp. FSL R7-0337]|uniref:type A chloramphenicol O-acetyltransferase n=1 Tax=Paenibacillus sp. FSL R7-0337 TaxID=1926588 RepID=UPI00096E04CB|nr:type A chloramphenicol O-acetyltransferase [Paenibacillus sp. FSL R7-0337]OMF94199.1 type A chloramphenicol O-acetyltransferase [Paenibacillus sp. FSL R7-0337]
MIFNLIDRDNWKRQEIFNHYLNQGTTFSLTAEIEISVLYRIIKQQEYKLYPALLFLMTRVVNSNIAFRMGYNCTGELGYWDKVDPLYTIADSVSESFSAIWTAGTNDFKAFHDAYVSDVENYKDSGRLFPKTPIPEHTFSVSMIPWTSFTGFNLNISNNGNYLLPIITAGKFTTTGDSIYLPLSLQVHHAVCDGYHAGWFMNEVQAMADRAEEWIGGGC